MKISRELPHRMRKSKIDEYKLKKQVYIMYLHFIKYRMEVV